MRVSARARAPKGILQVVIYDNDPYWRPLCGGRIHNNCERYAQVAVLLPANDFYRLV